MERMEKQLTVVDILYKFLYEMESFEGFDPYSFNQEAVFKRAKEMEKNYYICSKCKSKLDEKDMQQMQNRKKD